MKPFSSGKLIFVSFSQVADLDLGGVGERRGVSGSKRSKIILMSGTYYRKNSCISRTFLPTFWVENRGCGLYTRPLLSAFSSALFSFHRSIFISTVGFSNEENCCLLQKRIFGFFFFFQNHAWKLGVRLIHEFLRYLCGDSKFVFNCPDCNCWRKW